MVDFGTNWQMYFRKSFIILSQTLAVKLGLIPNVHGVHYTKRYSSAQDFHTVTLGSIQQLRGPNFDQF